MDDEEQHLAEPIDRPEIPTDRSRLLLILAAELSPLRMGAHFLQHELDRLLESIADMVPEREAALGVRYIIDDIVERECKAFSRGGPHQLVLEQALGFDYHRIQHHPEALEPDPPAAKLDRDISILEQRPGVLVVHRNVLRICEQT